MKFTNRHSILFYDLILSIFYILVIGLMDSLKIIKLLDKLGILTSIIIVILSFIYINKKLKLFVNAEFFYKHHKISYCIEYVFVELIIPFQLLIILLANNKSDIIYQYDLSKIDIWIMGLNIKLLSILLILSALKRKFFFTSKPSFNFIPITNKINEVQEIVDRIKKLSYLNIELYVQLNKQIMLIIPKIIKEIEDITNILNKGSEYDKLNELVIDISTINVFFTNHSNGADIIQAKNKLKDSPLNQLILNLKN